MRQFIITTMAGLMLIATGLMSTADAGRWHGRFGAYYHYPAYHYPVYNTYYYAPPSYYYTPYSYGYNYGYYPGFYNYHYTSSYPSFAYGPGFSIWW